MDCCKDQETPDIGIADPCTGNVLTCPVCGCDVPSSQQKLLVAFSMMNEPEAEVVVCHCPESHRFVASFKRLRGKACSA
jgi:hypothetical protein